MRRLAIATLGALALAGCSGSADGDGPSRDEAQQLNEAAASIDINATAPDAPADNTGE